MIGARKYLRETIFVCAGFYAFIDICFFTTVSVNESLIESINNVLIVLGAFIVLVPTFVGAGLFPLLLEKIFFSWIPFFPGNLIAFLNQIGNGDWKKLNGSSATAAGRLSDSEIRRNASKYRALRSLNIFTIVFTLAMMLSVRDVASRMSLTFEDAEVFGNCSEMMRIGGDQKFPQVYPVCYLTDDEKFRDELFSSSYYVPFDKVNVLLPPATTMSDINKIQEKEEAEPSLERVAEGMAKMFSTDDDVDSSSKQSIITTLSSLPFEEDTLLTDKICHAVILNPTRIFLAKLLREQKANNNNNTSTTNNKPQAYSYYSRFVFYSGFFSTLKSMEIAIMARFLFHCILMLIGFLILFDHFALNFEAYCLHMTKSVIARERKELEEEEQQANNNNNNTSILENKRRHLKWKTEIYDDPSSVDFINNHYHGLLHTFNPVMFDIMRRLIFCSLFVSFSVFSKGLYQRYFTEKTDARLVPRFIQSSSEIHTSIFIVMVACLGGIFTLRPVSRVTYTPFFDSAKKFLQSRPEILMAVLEWKQGKAVSSTETAEALNDLKREFENLDLSTFHELYHVSIFIFTASLFEGSVAFVILCFALLHFLFPSACAARHPVYSELEWVDFIKETTRMCNEMVCVEEKHKFQILNKDDGKVLIDAPQDIQEEAAVLNYLTGDGACGDINKNEQKEKNTYSSYSTSSAPRLSQLLWKLLDYIEFKIIDRIPLVGRRILPVKNLAKRCEAAFILDLTSSMASAKLYPSIPLENYFGKQQQDGTSSVTSQVKGTLFSILSILFAPFYSSISQNFSKNIHPNNFFHRNVVSRGLQETATIRDGMSLSCLMNNAYPRIHRLCKILRENCFTASYNNGRDKIASGFEIDGDINNTEENFFFRYPSVERLVGAENTLAGINFILLTGTKDHFVVACAIDLLRNPNFHYCIRRTLYYWKHRLMMKNEKTNDDDDEKKKKFIKIHAHEELPYRNKEPGMLLQREMKYYKYSVPGFYGDEEEKKDNDDHQNHDKEEKQQQNDDSVTSRRKDFEKQSLEIIKVAVNALEIIRQPLQYLQAVSKKNDNNNSNDSNNNTSNMESINELAKSWQKVWNFDLARDGVDTVVAEEGLCEKNCRGPVILSEENNFKKEVTSDICEVNKMDARCLILQLMSNVISVSSSSSMNNNNSQQQPQSESDDGATDHSVDNRYYYKQCQRLLFVSERLARQDAVFAERFQVLAFVNQAIERSFTIATTEEQQVASTPPINNNKTKTVLQHFIDLSRNSKVGEAHQFFSCGGPIENIDYIMEHLLLTKIPEDTSFSIQDLKLVWKEETSASSAVLPTLKDTFDQEQSLMHLDECFLRQEGITGYTYIRLAMHQSLYFLRFSLTLSHTQVLLRGNTSFVPHFATNLLQAAKTFCYIAQVLNRTGFTPAAFGGLSSVIAHVLANEWERLQAVVSDRPNFGSEEERTHPDYYDSSSPMPLPTSSTSSSSSSSMIDVRRIFSDSDIMIRTETCLFLALGLVNAYESCEPVPEEQSSFLKTIMSHEGLTGVLGILLPDLSKKICDAAMERAVQRPGIKVITKDTKNDDEKNENAVSSSSSDDDDDGKSGDEDRCSICLVRMTKNPEDRQQNRATTEVKLIQLEKCNHLFHLSCGASFLANKANQHDLRCPFCRTPVG